jgi:hypothetical protein
LNAACVFSEFRIVPPFWYRICDQWNVSSSTSRQYLSHSPSPSVSSAIALAAALHSSHVVGTSTPFFLKTSVR